MKSKYDYDIIRDYLHGLTDQETTARIRELIHTDEIARNVAAGILQLDHEFNGNEEEIEAYIEALRQKQLGIINNKDNRKDNTRILSSGLMKIAAAILLIAVVSSIVWLQRGNVLEDELSEPYPLAILDRSESDVNKGFEFYIKRDYTNAIRSFDTSSNDVSVVFYNGLSNLYAGEYDRAVELLSTESLNTSRYDQQAKWFKSLALLKAGRKDEAKASLESISNDPLHYKSETAKELLSAGID